MANNVSDLVSAPFIGEHIDQATRIACAVIGSVMVVIAVFGNSTLSVIVLKNFLRNSRKNLHDLFIFSLVLDDLLLMGYWFLFFVLDLALGYHPVVDAAHCTVNGIVLIVLYMVNLDLLVSISFNRYLHVCHYHLYRRFFTLRSTATWCLLVWVFSLTLSLPPLWGGAAGFYFYNTRTHVCSYNRDGFTYLKVLVILYTIFPPLLIAYFNIAIFRFWRKARMSLKSRYPLAKTEQGKKKKKFQLTEWKTRLSKKKADPESPDADGQVVHFQHKSPQDLVGIGHKRQAADCYSVKHQTGALPESTDEQQMPTSGPDVEQITHALQGDDDSRGDLCKNATHKSSSDSESEEDSVNNSEDSTSDDKSENHQRDEKTGEGGGSNRPEFRKKTGTFTTAAKMIFRHQAEETETETETETDETRNDTDSRQLDSSSATGTSSTVLTSSTTPSSSSTAKKTTTLTRGKQHKQTKTAQHNQQQMRKKSQSREKAFVRSLLVVCLLALCTFLPYTALVMVDTYIKLPKEVHIAANLMVFFNNTVNWIVYGAMNQAFRRGYVKYARQILNFCRR